MNSFLMQQRATEFLTVWSLPKGVTFSAAAPLPEGVEIVSEGGGSTEVRTIEGGFPVVIKRGTQSHTGSIKVERKPELGVWIWVELEDGTFKRAIMIEGGEYIIPTRIQNVVSWRPIEFKDTDKPE